MKIQLKENHFSFRLIDISLKKKKKYIAQFCNLDLHFSHDSKLITIDSLIEGFSEAEMKCKAQVDSERVEF